MQRRTRWIVGGMAVGVLLGTGAAGIPASVGVGGDDTPLSGPIRDRAVAAALDHVGGGTVTETEMGDSGAAYGVGILKDGSQVEVNLDRNFKVIGTEDDDADPDSD